MQNYNLLLNRPKKTAKFTFHIPAPPLSLRQPSYRNLLSLTLRSRTPCYRFFHPPMQYFAFFSV